MIPGQCQMCLFAVNSQIAMGVELFFLIHVFSEVSLWQSQGKGMT